MPIVSERDWSKSKPVLRAKRKRKYQILMIIFGLFDFTVLLFVAGIIAGMVRDGGEVVAPKEKFVQYYFFWDTTPKNEVAEQSDNTTSPVDTKPGNGLSDIIDDGGDLAYAESLRNPEAQTVTKVGDTEQKIQEVSTAETTPVINTATLDLSSYISTSSGTLYQKRQYGGVTYDLYLPNTPGTYPVLYAFHGISSSQEELSDHRFGLWSFVKSGVASPSCIIVFPRKGRGNWKQITQATLSSFATAMHTTILPELGYGTDYNRIWYYGFSQGCYDTVYNIQAFQGLIKRAVLNDGKSGNIASLGLNAVYYIEAYENVVNVPSLETKYFTGAEKAYASFLNGYTGYVTVADLNNRGWGVQTRNHAYANGWICGVSGGSIPAGNPWRLSTQDVFYDMFTWFNQSF